MRCWFRWQRLRRRLPGLATSLWVIDPNGYLAGSRNLQLQGLVTLVATRAIAPISVLAIWVLFLEISCHS
jgi:hypothetical protein